MAKTVNELISELQLKVAYKLTSADIPITLKGKIVKVSPILYGGDGNYGCELEIKETD